MKNKAAFADDTEHFRFVARLLTVRAIYERADAAVLQAVGDEPAPALHAASVPRPRYAIAGT
jgi:hypothetical protein